MPRYCAVRVCRNRGGTASRQDKRISFYPFPLQDKPRLQEWVNNMKREEWTPSRHQYLCSEHFTEDCFDIRWGIRYLKNTAIPTIFPSAEDDGEKKAANIKRSPKAKTSISDTDPELTGFNSPVSKKKPLILSKTCKEIQSTTTNDTAEEHTEVLFELPVVLDSHLGLSAACEKPVDSEMPAQSPSGGLHSEEQAESTVTVLCCEPGSFSDGEANVDAAAFQAVLGQAFSFVPMELVKDATTGCFFKESRATDEEENISVYEHSYCRPDTDKDQLWRKILSLHAKILELDRREESTVAKIRALEHEIALLKRDGAVFKEKQKVLEDCISSVLI
ncbi:THAP domain-containing protein 5 [Archocentrus centrarchus]|uniref:THAP domain-containing protein 5 n=1 Tax=Archocentrus centrarchus TaxID=63155 RepID=UPI0011EA5067|nr:THAP domain-containing protein 5 [Archocentrus centrarchus]XP_030576195.1 THAP domain-containing protein 5 [Archocentrus centrarchus]